MCLTPSPSAASREKASHGELAESRGDQETLPGFHLESRREPSAPEQRPDRGTRDVRRARAEPFSAFLVPPLPRGVSKRRLSREKRRFSRAAIRSIFLKGEKAPVQTTAGWFTVGRPTGWFQFGFFRRAVSLCVFRERRALTRTLLLRRASLAPRDFFTSTNHRTASCIGPTTGCGTKPRWCL